MANNFRIDVRSNLKDIALKFEAATQKQIDAASVRALNRTATTVRAAASREIRQEYNIKAAGIRHQIAIERARRGHVTASVVVSGRRIPLVDFSARQTRAGVTVQVKRGSRKFIPHAFLATMRSGHHGVFVRAMDARTRFAPTFRFGPGSGRKNRRWGDPDTPVAELTSLSLPRAFLQRKISASLRKLAIERFQIEFTRDLKFRIGR